MGDDEKDAFFVVRKGDLIGIYKSFADCKAQAGFSPLDPSVSVYKGYNLSKEAETFLASRGLKQAGFTIGASDVQDGIFGPLSICPVQDVVGSSSMSVKNYADLHASAPVVPGVTSSSARFQKQVGTGLDSFSDCLQQQHIELKHYTDRSEVIQPSPISAGSSSHLAVPQNRTSELKNYMGVQQPVHRTCQSCTIEFDGASKGNPGLAGAGALLRATDGIEVWRLREGVGIATNNVAEYRSVILGLKTALEKGFKHVHVRGDSLLVCNQIQGKWKTKNENMANLCKEALELKKQFASFIIEHVPREFNSDADAQANRAINLRDGQVEMDVTR